ncbi:MAG: hypothetical protein NVSMB65_07640 [Chloroflexota bacterium]
MNAEQLLQFVSNALFIAIFPVVAVRAVRQPLRAHVDTALLFAAFAFLVALSWLPGALQLARTPALMAITGALVMALPYLLLRLVDDFSTVPRRFLRLAEAGLAASIVALALVPRLPVAITLLLVAYFVVLAVYDAQAFVGAAHRGSGVTRRRM